MLRHPRPVPPTVLPKFVQFRQKERDCPDSIFSVVEWIFQLGWDLESRLVLAGDGTR